MKLFQKILVPTDFSPHAQAALDLATELAKTCGAALCVLHAYDVIPYTLPEGMPLYDAGQLERMRQELGKQLALAKQSVEKAGVREVDTKLCQGQTYAEIISAAESWGADVIVMGTHGRTGLAHLLLGSTAEKVVRKSPCAVITVPLKQEVKAKS